MLKCGRYTWHCTNLIEFEFFELVLFAIEDFRCAETIPGTTLVEFGCFRA